MDGKKVEEFKISIRNAHKLIRSLTPLQVFDIITRGVCDHHLPEISREIIELRGKWYLENWNKDFNLDILKIYLSDNGFKLYTTKQEAKQLEIEFKSWGVFHDINSAWYGGSDVYTVGFNYGHSDFCLLYSQWLRDKKLSELV